MLIKVLFEMLLGLLKLMFHVVPNIPKFPEQVKQSIQYFSNMLASYVGFVNLFIPVKFAITLGLLALTIKNSKSMFKFIMFVLRKIPFLNVS